MTTISQARLGKWYREFSAESVAIGVARGIEEERTRSRSMIQQMVAIKFGNPVADRLAALLSADSTRERLEEAAIAIMECREADELLSRVAGTVAVEDNPR